MKNEMILKNQKAMNYIIYMIVGSYFKKTNCVSFVQEKRLFLFYKDLNINKQFSLEEKCIRFAESTLKRKLPDQIWNEEVTVSFVTENSTGNMIVYFSGKGWVLQVKSNFMESKKDLFTYSLKEKVCKKEVVSER